MTPSNESSNRNQSHSSGKQAAGRGKSAASHTPRGAATDKTAQRRGGQHSHGGR